MCMQLLYGHTVLTILQVQRQYDVNAKYVMYLCHTFVFKIVFESEHKHANG
jgi:hypothetical protein